MNSEIMPYSNIVFPTVKKIFDVLDREKAHVKILLKHETVIEFLQKFELTVDFYFKAEKKDITVDCNILDWEKCAKKIESLFLIKSGDPEKLQFDEFYVRIKDKFHANGFEKYAHCLDVPEDRLAYVTKRKSGIEFNSIMDLIIKKMQTSQVIPVNLNDSEELLLQHILIDLKNEAECFDQFPKLFKNAEAKVEFDFIQKNVNLIVGDKNLFAYIKVSPEVYSEAQILFKKYPLLKFKDNTVFFYTLDKNKILANEKILNSLKKINKSPDCDLIYKVACSIHSLLSIYSNFMSKLALKSVDEIVGAIAPCYFNFQNEIKFFDTVEGTNFASPKFNMCVNKIEEIVYFWKEIKKHQEQFYNFGIQKLGENIKEYGGKNLKYTKTPDFNETIPSYPGSSSKSIDHEKFFNSMLKEHHAKNFQNPIPAPLKETKEDGFLPNHIINLTKNNSKNDVVVSKKEKKEKVFSEKKIEPLSKPKSLIQKAKKVVKCVDETVKILKKDAQSSSSYHKPPVLNPAIIKLAAAQPKVLDHGALFPGEPFLFNKDLRVTRWEMQDFNADLTQEIFPDHDYFALPQSQQKWMKIIHNPHIFVDNFLSFGFDHQWYLEEQEFQPCTSIPTVITYMGKSFKGLTQYTFTTNKKRLYHKCFKYEFESNDPLKKNLRSIDFPIIFNKTKEIQYGSTKVILKDNGHVTFIDKARDVTVELFKNTETVIGENTSWGMISPEN